MKSFNVIEYIRSVIAHGAVLTMVNHLSLEHTEKAFTGCITSVTYSTHATDQTTLTQDA
jgi:hypothetical protein